MSDDVPQLDRRDLEEELRRSRHAPSDDFVRAMSERVRPGRRESVRRAGGFRLAPLTGIIVLVLVAAGVFGGIAVANGGGGGGDVKGKRGHHTKPDDDQYKGKVVGFCNPGCRDKFEKATAAFDASIDGNESNG